MKLTPIISCCVLPRLHAYPRFFFSVFLTTELSPNPSAAAVPNWRLTRGNLLPLSLLTHAPAEIPVRPSVCTLRAAAHPKLPAAPHHASPHP